MKRAILRRRVNSSFAMAIAAVFAVVFLLPAPARAALMFTSGPSVRVNPNVSVEIEWITDVTWFGEAAVFDNPDGTGIPVAEKRSEDTGGNAIEATQHAVTINVPAQLAADTAYFFRVRAIDPTNGLPAFSTPTPLPPFFTGAQTIDNVFVQPGFDSALISWEANVIGFGQVDFGLTTPGDLGTLTDDLNITDHAIELTGLSPGTTYQFRVSNRHAIDKDPLVEQTGSFTTLSAVPEPSSLALLACGALALCGYARRRRQR